MFILSPPPSQHCTRPSHMEGIGSPGKAEWAPFFVPSAPGTFPRASHFVQAWGSTIQCPFGTLPSYFPKKKKILFELQTISHIKLMSNHLNQNV